MKHFLVISLLVILGCQRSNESEDSSNLLSSLRPEEELRETVSKIWEDAANGDTVALKRAHLNSPKFSKFGPRVALRQDVESTNRTESEHFSSVVDASFSIEELKVDLFGEVAVTTFYNNYSFTKNNSKIEGKGRVTLIFLQTEDGWKIIHEHSSPFIE